MSIFCKIEDLKSESDVEQKFIYQVVISKDMGLGYDPSEVRTKSHLFPCEIDKGGGKKGGYFPDYVVYLAGMPLIVIEAKSPNEKSEVGFREAQLYSLELNKKYPSGFNPVSHVISTNGKEILVGKWDSGEYKRITFEDISRGNADYEAFILEFKRDVFLKIADNLRQRVDTIKWHRPLSILGGHGRQNEELPPNTFAIELFPLLQKYFDSDSMKVYRDIIERAYCPTNQTTQYNQLFESLLKDNLARIKFPEVVAIETSKSDAPDFNSAMQRAVNIAPSAQLLIIGGVGAGKSMFLNRFYEFLINPVLKGATKWAFIDFNKAPDTLTDIENWICGEFLRDFEARNSIPDFLVKENLEKYFAREIRLFSEGAFRDIKKSQPAEYELRLADLLAELQKDTKKLAKGVAEFYSQSNKLVLVFDNSDKRDRDQQLRIFQSVQWMRNYFNCFTILALRDETYDCFKDNPPLDAYFKPFIFRIQPPRFINVVKKRLELAIEEISRNATDKLSFTLPNGATVEYPKTKLGDYLIAVYKALFASPKHISLVLEAISGKNVRKALQMFTEILISGHLSESTIFSMAAGERTKTGIPEWLILRILMRTKYLHYTPSHGYITNLFAINQASPHVDNFLLVSILQYLSDNRKKPGDIRIEGYIAVSRIVDNMTICGYLKEDILWGLELLLNHGLVLADHQRETGITLTDCLKISASGYFHMGILLQRLEYIHGVALDTSYNQKGVAERLMEISKAEPNLNMRQQLDVLSLLTGYLNNEDTRLASYHIGPENSPQCRQYVLDTLKKTEEFTIKQISH